MQNTRPHSQRLRFRRCYTQAVSPAKRCTSHGIWLLLNPVLGRAAHPAATASPNTLGRRPPGPELVFKVSSRRQDSVVSPISLRPGLALLRAQRACGCSCHDIPRLAAGIQHQRRKSRTCCMPNPMKRICPPHSSTQLATKG